MVKIPKKAVRALPRVFNAHNLCIVENCGNRAIARVRFPGGVLLDVCKICLPNCPAGIEVLEKIT